MLSMKCNLSRKTKLQQSQSLICTEIVLVERSNPRHVNGLKCVFEMTGDSSSQAQAPAVKVMVINHSTNLFQPNVLLKSQITGKTIVS